MKFIMTIPQVKEWILDLVSKQPEYWKHRTVEYGDGVIEHHAECFVQHMGDSFGDARKLWLEVISEALDVICHINENFHSKDNWIEWHLNHTGHYHMGFDVTFYWEEKKEQ